MNLVITGGAGFIGQTLVKQAIAAGYHVTVIDRVPTTDAAGSGGAVDAIDSAHLSWITADLSHDSDIVSDALGTADCVIHLAACPGVRDTSADIEQRRYFDNVLATEIVARRTPGSTPLIAFSSSSVYGGATIRRGIVRGSCESDALSPRGGYAASKVRAESFCSLRAARGGQTLCVRPFTVLGENQRHDMAVSLWRRRIMSGEPVTLFGSFERTRDFTDVRDVADATLALLSSGATGTVNLGTGTSCTLTELVRCIASALDVPARVQVRPAPPREVAHTLADTTVLRSHIGWVPHTSLQETVARAMRSLATAPPIAARAI